MKQQNLQNTLWGSPSSSISWRTSGCKTSGGFNQHRGEVDVPWDACQAIPSTCKTFICQTRASQGHGELFFPKSLLKRCYSHSSANMLLTAVGNPWLSQEEFIHFNDSSGKLGLFIKIYLFQLQSKGQGMQVMPTALQVCTGTKCLWRHLCSCRSAFVFPWHCWGLQLCFSINPGGFRHRDHRQPLDLYCLIRNCKI